MLHALVRFGQPPLFQQRLTSSRLMSFSFPLGLSYFCCDGEILAVITRLLCQHTPVITRSDDLSTGPVRKQMCFKSPS
jgi:hypothetical protein